MNVIESRKMMKYKFVIPGRFPGMNEFIAACNRHPKCGNRMKQENQRTVAMIARSKLRGIKVNEPIQINYTYYEPNRNRDLDNVSGFFHKICQDALVSCGILKNDGWNNIKGYSDRFFVDKENPRIEIELEEVEE